ncbi:TIGR02444 family protein [Agaribacterium sp. ZY112]|uniref:TIGR02444 family protein n=1 Tax=Agaribacterium sp. ZY112 TaxID=3233574 RepID=UPI0035253C10
MPFKNFAFELWDNSEFEKICLALQNQKSLNVLALLYRLWLEHERLELSEPALNQSANLLRKADADLLDLFRALRRQLKECSLTEEHLAPLKQQVLKIELIVEKKQLAAMQAHTDRHAKKVLQRPIVVAPYLEQHVPNEGVELAKFLAQLVERQFETKS